MISDARAGAASRNARRDDKDWRVVAAARTRMSMKTNDGKKVPTRSRKTSSETVAPMRAERAKPATSAKDTVAPPAAAERVSNEERYRMIQEQAYALAEARGFEPGHEVDDWLSAERTIDERLAHRAQA
jgi:hypothetical protein